VSKEKPATAGERGTTFMVEATFKVKLGGWEESSRDEGVVATVYASEGATEVVESRCWK
jgi:hypothetical protein